MAKVEVIGVEWDGTTELPRDVTLEIEESHIKKEKEQLDEVISEALSNEYGYCHFGWEDYTIDQ